MGIVGGPLCRIYIHWNLSNLDTTGPKESVLISGVSLFQGLKNTQHGTWGGRKCLERHQSLFQGHPHRGVPL